MVLSVINTLRISSCSDVFVQRNKLTNELEVLLHPYAVYTVEENNLFINHPGKTRIRKRVDILPVIKMAFYVLTCVLSILEWDILPLLTLILLYILEMQSFYDIHIRLSEQYLVHRFDSSSCINSVISDSTGDITLSVENLATGFRIESYGTGDISLESELNESFHSLEVIHNNEGSIDLGNAVTDKAKLILNGNGSISRVKIVENATVSLTGNGTIGYSRLENTVITRNFTGTGTLKEMKQ